MIEPINMTNEELLERIGTLEAEADDLKNNVKELREEMADLWELLESKKDDLKECEEALLDIQSITKKFVWPQFLPSTKNLKTCFFP